MTSPPIAIIGAGMAGLACARRLVERGLDVQLFEKARGPGGRMASRRRGRRTFDLGAQYFTARSAGFHEAVRGWVGAGVVAQWLGRWVRIDGSTVTPAVDTRLRYVGTPRMSALTRWLSQGLSVRTEARVQALRRGPDGWSLELDSGSARGPFSAVVVTAPPAQAAALLIQAPRLAAVAAAATMAPCWATMLEFATPAPIHWDAAEIDGGPLSWVARDGSKPGRSGDTWVLHASPAWSAAHLEAPADTVAREMLGALGALVPKRLPAHRVLAHRWRYARVLGEPSDGPALWDPSTGLGLAGDWLVEGRVEGAWRSGHALANLISRQSISKR